MKKASFLSPGSLALLVSGFISASVAGGETPKGTPTPASVSIPVKGMSCMACVAATKQKLKAVPGVTGVEVKLNPGSATIQYDPAKVTTTEIVAAIRDLGYQAGTPAGKAAK